MVVSSTSGLVILALAAFASQGVQTIPTCRILAEPKFLIGQVIEADATFASGPSPDGGTWIESSKCSHAKKLVVEIDNTSGAKQSLFWWLIRANHSSTREHRYGVFAHARFSVHRSKRFPTQIAVTVYQITDPKLVRLRLLALSPPPKRRLR